MSISNTKKKQQKISQNILQSINLPTCHRIFRHLQYKLNLSIRYWLAYFLLAIILHVMLTYNAKYRQKRYELYTAELLVTA